MQSFIWPLLIFLLSLNIVKAQSQQKTDSLLSILVHNHLSDSQRIQVLRHIAHWHPKSNEGLYYAQQSVELAAKLNDRPQLALGLERVGTHQRLLGNKTDALTAILKALQIYEELGQQDKIAAIYIQLGEYQVLDGHYEQAKAYFNRGINLYIQLKDDFQLAVATINLGEAYRLSEVADSAANCFKMALKLNETINEQAIQGYAIGNLGMVSHSMGKYDQAQKELLEAINILTTLGDPYSVSIYKAEMGQVYIKEQQYHLGENELLAAFQLVKQEQLKESIRDISKMLADFYENQERYQASLRYQKIFQLYQDSLLNRENIQEIEQIKANYEIDKRENEISGLEEKQRQQKQISYALAIGGSIFLLLALSLMWSYRKLAERKKTIEKREQEKILLLKELNHRVKNNLQMISSLLNLQSRQFKDHPAKVALTAGKLRVEAMSLIHQKLYQEDFYAQISIKEYMVELVQGLHTAYSGDVELNFQIHDVQLDIDLAIPLALIINELAVNAFKYAFHDIDQPCLTISFIEEKEQFKLEIKDNGVGMQSIDLAVTTSFGLKLVHSLVKQLEGKIYMKDEEGSTWHIIMSKQNMKITDNGTNKYYSSRR